MTSQSAATLRSRYMQQAASDLAENRRRQQELAAQIEVLKQEESLLADILELAERYDEFADASRPSGQAQEEPVAAKAKRTPARTPAKRSEPAGKAAKAGVTGKPSRPLLGDLLADLLGRHKEPRLAAELRDELMDTYPDRSPTPQVVRNTLESLVAKGRIQRHKQQRSVLYALAKSHAAGDTA